MYDYQTTIDTIESLISDQTNINPGPRILRIIAKHIYDHTPGLTLQQADRIALRIDVDNEELIDISHPLACALVEKFAEGVCIMLENYSAAGFDYENLSHQITGLYLHF